MNVLNIPFNKPYITGRELFYIAQAHADEQLAGDGDFTKKCNTWLEKNVREKDIADTLLYGL